jgi:hypothetical protein
MNVPKKFGWLLALALSPSLGAGSSDVKPPEQEERSPVQPDQPDQPDQPVQPDQSVQPDAPETPDTGDRRDPFRTSGKMQSEARKAEDGPRFLPGSAGRVPSIRLSGYAEIEGQPPLALIEIDQHGTHVVRENDVISLQGGSGDNVLKVIQVTNLTVSVEVGSLGHVIVVR